MAIENTYLLGKNITLGCGFDLQAKAPLDSRQTVPAFAGLQALIDGNAAYEGMIVYDEETKKTYQAQLVDDVLAFREFGINEAELKNLIASETTAAMEFKGATDTLPENPSKGDMWKVVADFKIDDEDVKVGDSIVYNGEQWYVIPSGDDIEDTWRPVAGVDNDATLTFVAGDKLEKTVATDGTITYKHAAIDAPTNMNEEGDEQTRTYITQLIADNHGHIIGFKTATENVEDTNTTYEFEGLPVGEDEVAPSSVYFQVKASDAESAEVVYLDAYSKNEADGKFVAKEGHIAYTQDEKDKLAGLSNYNDEEVRGLIGDNTKAIEDLEKYVGTIPADEKYADVTNVISYINKKAEETLASAQGGSSETAASVKQQLDNYKSENNTRVKDVEDAVDAIEADYLKAADKDELSGEIANVKATAEAAATKAYTDEELAKKVDKVEGKDLIATSEITRLADVHNYDDTQVKADIAKKADTETMTTELAKKVDKVEGKSLILDSEIERLAGLHNYDDTQVKADIAKKADTETMTTELGKKVDKVDGYSLVSDTEIARLAEVDNYDDKEVRGLIANRYTKEEADDKFAIKGADAYDDTALSNRVKAIEDDYLKGEHETALGKRIDLKADKSVVDEMYTNGHIDDLIAEAKKYADDNDADTKYGIVYDSDNKKIKLVEGGTDVEIDATDFIKDGMIETVTLSEDGLNLIIAWNTDSDKGENNVTTIPLAGLVDVYTGVDGTTITVNVSSDDKISAEVKVGSIKDGHIASDAAIAKGKLAADVQASLALADSALQEHQNIDHLATKDELNGVDGKFANYTTTADLKVAFELKADKTQVADDIEAAKSEAISEASNQDAVVLAESQAFAESKVNALADGQVAINKNDIASIMELLTWGSF